jgi:RimJ/RimL family protein N-acetyltransferase
MASFLATTGSSPEDARFEAVVTAVAAERRARNRVPVTRMRRTLHHAAGSNLRANLMEPLTTRSLVLEPLKQADYPYVVQLYEDPEVMRYIGNGPRAATETRQRLDWFLDQAEQAGFGYWVVRDRATREPLGGAMLMVRSPGSKMELGFALARTAWGRGVATEAAQALIDHAFEAIGVPEVEAFTHQDNAASGAVLRKAGLRDAGLSTGPYGHVDRRYAITREEWRSTRAR